MNKLTTLSDNIYSSEAPPHTTLQAAPPNQHHPPARFSSKIQRDRDDDDDDSRNTSGCSHSHVLRNREELCGGLAQHRGLEEVVREEVDEIRACEAEDYSGEALLSFGVSAIDR